MDGLNVGTLFALLRLDNQMSPELVQASRDVEQFGATAESVAAQVGGNNQGSLSQAIATTSDVLPIMEATATNASGAVTKLGLSGAATGTAVGTLSTHTSAAATAQQMMAEMVKAANDAIDKEHASMILAAQSSSAFDVALTGVGTAIGLIGLALLAFGPRIYELIGGWEGVKSAGEEAYSVLEDLAQILEDIGGHVIGSFVGGLSATLSVLPAIGGFVVDLVVALSEFWLIAPAVEAVGNAFGFLRDMIHAAAADGSFDDLVSNLKDLQATGFSAPDVSFGIDPEDTDAVNAYSKEVDALIAKSDPLRASYTELKGSINSTSMVFQEFTVAQQQQMGITTELTAEQKKYNAEIQRLTEQFSGAGALELAKQYEIVLKNIGGATALTEAETAKYVKVFEAVIDKYELLGPSGAKVVAHFTALKDSLEKDVLPTMGNYSSVLFASAVDTKALTTAATENMNAQMGLTSKGLIPVVQNTDLMRLSMLAVNPIMDASAQEFGKLNQNVSQAVSFFENWRQRTYEIAASLLYLGSVIPGVMGSILTFAGTAVQAFLTLNTAISTVKTSWSTMTTAFSGGFSLGGISTLLGGISSIVGAVGGAIQMFSALGSAIKRAFTSEETELVNPNRDLFTSQFIGAETDPFQAIGNSTIRAAMQVYGVDWDTAWAQYAEPLIRQLQDADTYAEFKTAQLNIAELFRQAGVTLDIFNEAGIATQYRSGVFDTATAFNAATSYGSAASAVSSFDTTQQSLIALERELAIATRDGNQAKIDAITFQIGQLKTGAGSASPGGTYGGTAFQTGTMPSSAAGFCVHVENLYVNGATGQQQAKSFFDALYSYVTGGGDALSKWRDLNCAAGAV